MINAHRGCLQFFAGRFYLYGIAFGPDDTTTTTQPIVGYSSPDLQKWTFDGSLLQKQPDGVYTRPFVVFNLRTRKFVLWYNWFPKLWNGQAGVAVSDTPIGPFVVVNPKAHLLGSRPGDGSLFVDDDGSGYYIYTDMADNYAVRVERLTPDFLDASGKASNIMARGAEAPVLFRRKNLYYALCGPLCPDSPRGSEVQVFASLSPLGPFSTRPSANINRGSLDANSALITNRPGAVPGTWFTIRPEASVPAIPAQQTWVAKIPAGGEPDYIWVGDQWGSAPDGVKAHDLQYWSAPLSFTADGRILPMKFVADWQITWAFNH